MNIKFRGGLLGLKDFLVLLKSLLLVMVSTAASLVEESFVKSYEMLKNQENVKSRSDKGYHAVPPPYTGNYIPPKPDLMFIDEQVESESVDVVSNVASSDVKTVMPKRKSVDVKNKEFEPKVEVKTVRPCIEKIKFVKTTREKEKKGGHLKLKELMEFSTKLYDRVLDLEKIKTAQANEIADLKKRVKKLERNRRSRTLGMNLFKIDISRRRSLGEEDASKHRRNLKQRSIFEESDFDVQAMMDEDYELTARLRAEEQRRKPPTKAQKRNQI
nr:hypothetical protein [Tanacetum cinerariifolium]